MDTKIITSYTCTRYLLKNGQNIIDIKPCKGNNKNSRTVFVFESNDEFKRILALYDAENYKATQKFKHENMNT